MAGISWQESAFDYEDRTCLVRRLTSNRGSEPREEECRAPMVGGIQSDLSRINSFNYLVEVGYMGLYATEGSS
jgi:hypothetical protein